MAIQTFKFKEGTVIIDVNQEVEFDMKTKIITDTGRFTACLIGGTAPGIKATSVRNAKGEARIFRSEEAAFKAALQVAEKLGYHPVSKRKK